MSEFACYKEITISLVKCTHGLYFGRGGGEGLKAGFHCTLSEKHIRYPVTTIRYLSCTCTSIGQRLRRGDMTDIKHNESSDFSMVLT